VFGYIRPLQGELKVRELERFKACYCGLCHSLGKKYGLAARFILNYELVFLSMLLWGEDEPVTVKQGRCIASPLCKKRYCTSSEALNICAGYSVILTRWKLIDTISDEPFVKALPHRLALLFLSRGYRKAARDFPEFDSNVKTELEALSRCEAEFGKSLDGAADKFATILRAAVPMVMPEKQRRPLSEMLYHIGRWIYIIDACDDYNRDVKSGNYNPVAIQYPPERNRLPDTSIPRLKTTLTHSNNLAVSAFELLPVNAWSQVIENMLYLGMPDACIRVFEGKWPPKCQKNKLERT